MDTPTPPPAPHVPAVPQPNPAVRTLRFVADLVEAGAGGADLSLTVRYGGFVVSVSPEGAGPSDSRPTPTANGLMAGNPAVTGNPVSVGDERSVAAAPAGPTIDPAKLLEHFLSTQERMILGDLAAHPGTAACDLHHRLGNAQVQQTRFWALWSNLQHRGLVEDSDGRGRGGFQLATPWVADLLAALAKPTAAVAAASSDS